MNRRQFLGRLFQSIISAHNSKSIYGVYHPWRQYNDIKTRVSIYMKYRVGVDSSGNYIYDTIPYVRNEGPIMAVYDSNGVMIYCSAYYYNNRLYNDISSWFGMDLPPDTYTVKCLSLGKGLYLGESGQSMTFTVKPVAREIDPSTGEYNKYNNYGWINTPSMTVDFLFDYEGLSFDFESEHTNCGRDIFSLDGVTTYTHTYSSYAEYSAAMNELGNTPDDFGYAFWCNATNLSYPTYEDQIYKTDIIEKKYYVHVYEHKGFENKSSRGKVDVSLFRYKDLLEVLAYNKFYNDNGLELNFDNLPDKYECAACLWGADDLNWTDSGRLYMRQYNNSDSSLCFKPVSDGTHWYINADATIGVSVGPSTSLHSPETDWKTTVNDSYRVSSKGYNVYTDKSSTSYVSLPILRFNISESYDVMYHLSGFTPNDSPRRAGMGWSYNGDQSQRRWGPTPTTPEIERSLRIKYAYDNYVPLAESIYAQAIANKGMTVEEAKAAEQHYFMNRYNLSSQDFLVPLDVIFGTNPHVLKYLDYQGEPAHNSHGITWYTDARGNKACVEDLFGLENPERSDPPVERTVQIPTSELDLTGYESCTDLSTGWISKYGIVLRQEIVHLDLSDVPDHRVQPN